MRSNVVVWKSLVVFFGFILCLFLVCPERGYAELTTVSPDFVNGPDELEWSIIGDVSYNNGAMIINNGILNLERDEPINYGWIGYSQTTTDNFVEISSDIKLYSQSKFGKSLTDSTLQIYFSFATPLDAENDVQGIALKLNNDTVPHARVHVWKTFFDGTAEHLIGEDLTNIEFDKFYNLKIKIFDQYFFLYIDDRKIYEYDYGFKIDEIDVIDSKMYYHTSIQNNVEGEVRNLKITYGEPLAKDPIITTKTTLNLSTNTKETLTISGGTGFFISSSSDSSIATGSLNGNQLTITGGSKGTANITIVDSEENTEVIEVTVIGISPSSLTLSPQESQTITVDGGSGFYQVASNDTSVAEGTIISGVITVTGIAPGTATITITDSNSEQYTVPVTVQTSGGTLSVSSESVDLKEGSTETIIISGGSPPYFAVSSDSSIAKATLAADKLNIEGVSGGTAEITLTDSASNSILITITVEKLEYLSVEPTSLTIPMLNTGKFKISGGTGYYQIESMDTTIATYTVTDDTVTVKGESIGTAKIIVTDSDGSSVLVPVTVTQKVKAIIVAASGPYTGNHLWDSTLACTNYAYKVLQYQGYTNETIKYLASETTLDINGDGIFDEVDGNATSSDLKNAITSWALDAKDVIVYIVGHGSKDSLRIDQNELVTSTELNTWFNTLEGYIPGKLSFIYDACQSGSFLSTLKQADSTKERILIASASLGENAYFTSLGSLSFSTLFWTQIHNGGNIKDSFAIAKNSIEYTYANQTPQLDDNGNGIGNEDDDGEVSEKAFIGNGVISAGDIPVIGDAISDKTLNGETSLVLYTDNITDSGDITKVWAIVTPPGFTTSDPDNPVLSVPTVEMSLVRDGKYEGIYTGFGSTGAYNVAFYAQDSEGNISLPKRTTIKQKTKSCQVDLTGHSVAGDQKINSPVTFTVNATSQCSDTLYYRFSLHPDYGTSGYTGLKWQSMTDTEYQTDNSCTYTFTKTGKYIIVVWVVTDPENANPTGVAIQGWSIDIREDSTCKTDITGSSMSGTQEVNKPISFTVNAQNDCSDNLYYRFSYHPYYGSDWYNGTQWTSMTDTEWVSTNTIDYSFTESGSYVVVVWISDTISNVDSEGIPIAGYNVDVE